MLIFTGVSYMDMAMFGTRNFFCEKKEPCFVQLVGKKTSEYKHFNFGIIYDPNEWGIQNPPAIPGEDRCLDSKHSQEMFGGSNTDPHKVFGCLG